MFLDGDDEHTIVSGIIRFEFCSFDRKTGEASSLALAGD
jgi:hypothetical protein